MEITVGTDPELFLKLDGKFISAAGLFPGTKDEPFPVEKGAVQVDGLALEFNIHPAKTAEEFNSNIETVLKQLEEMVCQVDPKLKMEFTPYAEFEAKYFKTIPDEHKILGCDPDYDYLGNVKTPPDIFERPFRTAAGHVHIGWTEKEEPMHISHFTDCKTVASYFRNKDIGIPYDNNDYLRLKYYGGSGAFRPKSYGVELRRFSNRWVKEAKTRMEMFHLIKNGMEYIAKAA